MTTAVIIDIAASALVVGFAAFGAWRGLLRAVAGLAVLVLALVGASKISATLTEPLAAWMMPRVESAFQERMEDTTQFQDAGDLADGTARESALASLADSLPLPEGFRTMLTETIQEKLSGLRSAASDVIRKAMTDAVHEVLLALLPLLAARLLFALSFFLLMLFLKLLLRLVDQFLDLPILSALNAAGGGLLGLAEGLLVLFVTVWILGYIGYSFAVPPLSETYVLRFLSGFAFPAALL